MIIGITGSSGSGKSTVCKILEKEYHAKIMDADKIAKQLSKKGTEYLAEIVQNFGVGILQKNRELNREKLANMIYQSREKREILNQCTFPYIQQEMMSQIQKATEELIVIDAPLLFEANLEKICDHTIGIITTNQTMQLQRMMQRDKIDELKALARITAQQNNQYYFQKCNDCIWNDNGVEELEKQLRKIMETIC